MYTVSVAWSPQNLSPPGSKGSDYALLRFLSVLRLGGCCSQCGEDDMRVLHLDHVYSVAAMKARRTQGKQVFEDILSKGMVEEYQVLCANCHERKTHYERTGSNDEQRVGNALKSARRIGKVKRGEILRSPLSAHYWAQALDVPVEAIVALREIHRDTQSSACPGTW